MNRFTHISVKAILLILSLFVMFSVFCNSNVFAEDYKTGSEFKGLEESGKTKLFPSIHALDIDINDTSFNDLLKDVDFYGRITYADGVAIGESYYNKENDKLTYNSSTSYSDESEKLLAQAFQAVS